ncbi:MAG: NADP-dependent isocitrate dehydrogenase [Rickettsiaceae bacterium]|nr:NADP-dependent isocitrate dehydrogenase [Rickettsiaceae bacterium]
MSQKILPITIAFGDGVGPEIMEATLSILKAAEARLTFNIIEVGKNIYEKGFNSGLMPSAWEELNNTKILLKAPITTPQGGGYKSLNVTIRKKLGLYANVRPVSSFHPFVETKHPKMDVVIIRENEEDLYTGIEHRQTDQSYQCLKIITRDGCEKIIRHAFEYAVRNGRKKVTCFSKDNIMKLTDGLFHNIFNEIAKEYPNITSDHYIIDIGTARLAAKPEIFDVIVTLNLYGDIISDVAAEISGSVGLAGSANIGKEFAMFEAIHGSAPDIAGKNIANPTGLLQAAIMMLVHVGQTDIANKIRNALLKTIEDGLHTADIYNEKTSAKKLGTKEFAEAVIANLGKEPKTLEKANFKTVENQNSDVKTSASASIAKKSLIGFDLFIDWQDEFDALLAMIKTMESEKFEIKMITAKGLVMWPQIDKHNQPTYPKGQTILRFIGKGISGKNSNDIIDSNKVITHQNLIEILTIFADRKVDFIKYEGLYLFDGKPGYGSGQGE